jgi:hypothetical protein
VVGIAARLVLWTVAGVAVMPACRFEPGALGGPDDARRDGMLDGPGGADDGATGGDAMIAADAMPDGPPALLCPPSYTLFDNARPLSRYRHVTASASWQVAEATCEADGGNAFLPAHLIVLDDEAERQWAFDQGTTDKWIGATDIKTEGTILAVTDQPSPFFGAAASNNMSKDCLYLDGSTTVMEVCSAGRPYLCECDGRAADPARYQ